MLLALLLFACTGAPKPGDDTPADADGDGFIADDCDDGNPAVNPGATEVCDAVDDDCDGAVDEDLSSEVWPDADGDGYGAGTSTLACDAPAGTAPNGDDCDDASADVHPGAAELCNSVDDNCDGTSDEAYGAWYTDADADGYGDPATAVETCTPTSGQVADGTDCNDADAAVNPGATEQCDYDDDNCDGRADLGVVQTWHSDTDGDGYGHITTTETTCDPQPGWVLDGTDCRPGDPEAYPGAAERCNDDDDDCDTLVDEDFELDEDGHTSTACGGDDCDDLDAAVYPGAAEVCGDGVDTDCDGRDLHCYFSGDHDESSADAKAYSSLPNYDAGERVDVGDVDGDGYQDVVIATMYADAYAGGAYVLPGPLSGTRTLDAAGYKISGTSATTSAGRSVGIGDVNGDGVDDVAIGAPDTTCKEWVLFGPITADVQLMDADVIRVGTYDTEVGHGSDIADVDGDGIGDLVVGAYEDDQGGRDAGAVFVEYGPVDAGTEDLLDAADLQIVGEAAGAYAGRYIRAGGDVDGDGLDDILAAAPYASGGAPSSGVAYLIPGGLTGDLDLASASGKYLGEAAGDYAGEGLALGDFDGDGLADVILGSYNSTAGYYAGAAYVVLGPAAGTVDLSAADFIIRGDTASQQVGLGLAVSDVDGDGAGELLVGGMGDATNGVSAGASWLFFGPPVGSLTLADADATFYGESAGDELGQSVAIGDLDGDGLGDLVFGAPGEATGGSAGGAAYVEYAQ
jgi:hypothetical protein